MALEGKVVALVVKEYTKIVGVILLIVSAVNLVTFGYFGIIGFARFLPAGIIALRYQRKEIPSLDPEDTCSTHSEQLIDV